MANPTRSSTPSLRTEDDAVAHDTWAGVAAEFERIVIDEGPGATTRTFADERRRASRRAFIVACEDLDLGHYTLPSLPLALATRLARATAEMGPDFILPAESTGAGSTLDPRRHLFRYASNARREALAALEKVARARAAEVPEPAAVIGGPAESSSAATRPGPAESSSAAIAPSVTTPSEQAQQVVFPTPLAPVSLPAQDARLRQSMSGPLGAARLQALPRLPQPQPTRPSLAERYGERPGTGLQGYVKPSPPPKADFGAVAAAPRPRRGAGRENVPRALPHPAAPPEPRDHEQDRPARFPNHHAAAATFLKHYGSDSCRYTGGGSHAKCKKSVEQCANDMLGVQMASGVTDEQVIEYFSFALDGGARDVFDAWEKTQVQGWTAEEAWLHLQATFEGTSLIGSPEHSQFTSAFTWSSLRAENPKEVTTEGLMEALIAKGHRLQRHMPPEYQHGTHLLTFLSRCLYTAPFYVHMSCSATAKTPGDLKRLAVEAAQKYVLLTSSSRVGASRGFYSTEPSPQPAWSTPEPPDLDARVLLQTGWQPTNETTVAFLAGQYVSPSDTSGDGCTVVSPGELDDLTEVMFTQYGKTKPYNSRGLFTDKSLRSANFRLGQRPPDSRDPPQRTGETANPSTKAGKQLRCWRCNSKWHLVFNCPESPLQSQQKVLLARVCESICTWYVEHPEVTDPDIPDAALESAVDHVLEAAQGAGEEPVEGECKVLYGGTTLPPPHLPSTEGTQPSPIIIDTGCPSTCSGKNAFRQDCLARGVDFDKQMAELIPSDKRFAFGATVLPSLGVGPLWFATPDGTSESIGWRHVVDSETLPTLLGIDVQASMGACIDLKTMTLSAPTLGNTAYSIELAGENHLYLRPPPFRQGPLPHLH